MIRRNFNLSALTLALSIAAIPSLVNGQDQSLTSVNKDKSSNGPGLKDSVKNKRADVAQLIETLLKTGVDGSFGSVLAPIVGLPKAMPSKDKEIVISQKDKDVEKRACYVVYENEKGSGPDVGEKKAVCAYIVKFKRSAFDKQVRYFRIDLNGKLEKAVLSESKYDETDKIVRGSGVKTDQDIDSPEVRKTFEAEMKFWLKDWLKKEQKNAAKKTADAAAAPPAAAVL